MNLDSEVTDRQMGRQTDRQTDRQALPAKDPAATEKHQLTNRLTTETRGRAKREKKDSEKCRYYRYQILTRIYVDR